MEYKTFVIVPIRNGKACSGQLSRRERQGPKKDMS